jgi:hypothetical protein
MPKATRIARIARAATLPETRRLLAAAARSGAIRGLARRAAQDRAGLLHDLRHPGDPRGLIRRAARHPAAHELANAGLTFLPLRYAPLRWVVTWAAARAVRRYIDRRVQPR